ncbi:MAG: hypothetical protein ABGY21_04065, partial [Pseudomonadota bacterium]
LVRWEDHDSNFHDMPPCAGAASFNAKNANRAMITLSCSNDNKVEFYGSLEFAVEDRISMGKLLELYL